MERLDSSISLDIIQTAAHLHTRVLQDVDCTRHLMELVVYKISTKEFNEKTTKGAS
jgi:hypothetical protein